MTSFTLNYLRKGSVTKYSYIGGLGLQHMDLGEHNSIHNIPLFFPQLQLFILQEYYMFEIHHLHPHTRREVRDFSLQKNITTYWVTPMEIFQSFSYNDLENSWNQSTSYFEIGIICSGYMFRPSFPVHIYTLLMAVSANVSTAPPHSILSPASPLMAMFPKAWNDHSSSVSLLNPPLILQLMLRTNSSLNPSDTIPGHTHPLHL